MAANQSTTIPRARGTRARHPTSIDDGAPSASPESRTNILGQMIDGIGFIETACVALEANDKTAFVMPCLHQGITMLRHAHDVLERADAETILLRRYRGGARVRRKRRRAPA
jgi:hypothetical protein